MVFKKILLGRVEVKIERIIQGYKITSRLLLDDVNNDENTKCERIKG